MKTLKKNIVVFLSILIKFGELDNFSYIEKFDRNEDKIYEILSFANTKGLKCDVAFDELDFSEESYKCTVYFEDEKANRLEITFNEYESESSFVVKDVVYKFNGKVFYRSRDEFYKVRGVL